MSTRKKRFYLLVVIVLVIVILNNHFKIIALNLGKDRSQEITSFSIMTFNVDATKASRFTSDFQERLLELIRQENPDVLCFQELSFENLDIIKAQLDSIYGPCFIRAGVDQSWRLRFYSHFPLRNFTKYHCQGDIVTKDFTEDEREEIELEQKQTGVMSAELEVMPGHWVTLFSGHLRSSAYSTARLSMEDDASWFDGMTLYKRNYEIGKRIRDYEAKNVKMFINNACSDGKPVIVAGDLNDWCGSDCLNILMGNDLKDAWWEGGNGFGWTYFGWHLRLRLDHILYSDELELVDVKVVDANLSDHKPLMARFRVK